MMIVINGKWVTGRQKSIVAVHLSCECSFIIIFIFLLLLWRIFLHFVKGKITLWMILHSYVHNASKKKKIMYGGIVKNSFFAFYRIDNERNRLWCQTRPLKKEKRREEERKNTVRERERKKDRGTWWRSSRSKFGSTLKYLYLDDCIEKKKPDNNHDDDDTAKEEKSKN